jgi:hypothetical protein
MQSFDVCENFSPKEINSYRGEDNNFGLALDLLKDGQNSRVDEHVRPGSEYKAGYPSLPEMSLVSPKDGPTMDSYIMEKSWGGDLYKWGKRLVDELKEVGYRIERGFEHVNPQDLLELAKDIAVVAAKFGPTIASDVAKVIKGKGLDPVADAKLLVDLAMFAKSPEAAQLGEDAMKVLREFQQKIGLTR